MNNRSTHWLTLQHERLPYFRFNPPETNETGPETITIQTRQRQVITNSSQDGYQLRHDQCYEIFKGYVQEICQNYRGF